ncbi:MAG: PKD domain-containing protein, partial [Flavobacteriales bacterium]|nr:PKD domain-containing protein [Flavobacteriales bacterium]
MKHFVLLSFLSFFAIANTQAQDCCNGFEANFTYGAMATPNGIEFENLCTGNWDFIVWNFGDGSSSNNGEPDHVYNDPGIYQVCVVIESNDGCRSELCYEVSVETTPDPCNDFLADYLWSVNPSNSLGVQFENISPLPSDFYVWNFGDGNTSTEMEPYHEYASGGMYQVCLVLETNDGCRSEYCIEVCVDDPEPEPPTALNCCEGFEAWFSYSPSSVENGIEFENLSAGNWDFIVWHFGDGSS